MIRRDKLVAELKSENEYLREAVQTALGRCFEVGEENSRIEGEKFELEDEVERLKEELRRTLLVQPTAALLLRLVEEVVETREATDG